MLFIIDFSVIVGFQIRVILGVITNQLIVSNLFYHLDIHKETILKRKTHLGTILKLFQVKPYSRLKRFPGLLF